MLDMTLPKASTDHLKVQRARPRLMPVPVPVQEPVPAPAPAPVPVLAVVSLAVVKPTGAVMLTNTVLQTVLTVLEAPRVARAVVLVLPMALLPTAERLLRAQVLHRAHNRVPSDLLQVPIRPEMGILHRPPFGPPALTQFQALAIPQARIRLRAGSTLRVSTRLRSRTRLRIANSHLRVCIPLQARTTLQASICLQTLALLPALITTRALIFQLLSLPQATMHRWLHPAMKKSLPALARPSPVAA